MPPLAVPRCCGSDLLRFVAAPPGGRRPKLTEAPASGLSGADLAGAASLLRQLAERLAALGLGLRNCAACGGQTAGARGEVVPGVCLRGLPSDVRRRLRLRLPLCGACHRAAISGQLAERRRSAACAAPAAGGAHRETAGSLAPAIGARSMAKVLLAWRQAPPQLQELARRKHAADAARREAAGSSEAEACGETYKALRKELAQAAQRADSGRRGWGRGSHSRSLVGRAVNTPPQELEHYLAAARECLGKSPGAEISHQELVALTRPPPGGRHAPPRPGARSSNNEGVAAAAGGGLCSLVRRWRQVWLSAVRPVGLAEGWDPPPEQTGRVESHPPRTSLAVLGEELAALVAAAPGGELPLEQLLQEYSLRFARSLRPEDYGFSRQKRLLRQAAGPLGLAVVQRANTLWLSSRCTTPSPPAAAGGPPAPKAQDDAEELDALRRWGLAGAVDAGATRLVALPPCELLRALRRAEAAGLTDVVVPGRTLAESAAASAVAGQSTASGAPAVWCTVGAAEWEWQGDPEGTAELLAALAAGEQSRCVALECAAGAGAELLEHLLGLAGRLGLPCVITAGDPREEQAATAALGRHPRVPVIVRSPPGAAPAWAGMGHYVAVAGLAGPVPPERLLLASAGGLAVGGGCPAEAWEPAALPAAARSCAAALGSGAQQTAALSGRNAAAVLRLGGAPLPQGDKECPFFRAHGWCKFGPRCGRGHGGGGLTLPPEVALGRPPCPGWTLRGLEIDFSARKVLRIRRDHRAAVQRLEAVCCAALQARQVPGTRRCGVIDGDAEGCWAALTMLRLAQGDTPGVVGCLWGPPPAAEAPAPVLSRRPCCPHCFKQLPACTGSHYSASPPLDGGAAAAAWDDAAHGGERACLWGGAAAAAILPLLEDAQGHAQRARTRAQLEGLLRRQYPRARLYMFGSAATGLALRGADTDFAAQLEPAPGGGTGGAHLQTPAPRPLRPPLPHHQDPRPHRRQPRPRRPGARSGSRGQQRVRQRRGARSSV
eukprot:TRINITY_DN9032_c1_g1_i1.p1 TRINITY_DN9032_c1_g1~~TRINITY_DN9032_c1_g1_i1.p1  ORF type:complete len:1025 (+),score=223.00 TRINITY_DN9032_c1_g1_i1:64-3075(+)